MSLITEPGVYDISGEEYHRDPVEGGSLSSTGARRILQSPALFKYSQTHRQPPKRAFDFGHAVHSELLGVGAPVHVIDADSYSRKAVQQERDEAYEAGEVPLLVTEWVRVQDAAAAVRRHKVAGALLARPGPCEQVMVWRDPVTGLFCRSMVDKQVPGPRLIVVDVKTATSAEPDSVAKSVFSFGYHQQGDFYLTGVRALGLNAGTDPAFVLVFVETTPPHPVTVAQLDPNALLWGSRLNRKAIDTWAHCVTTDTWPGYVGKVGDRDVSTDTGVISVDLPYWATKQLEDAHARGDLDFKETA